LTNRSISTPHPQIQRGAEEGKRDNQEDTRSSRAGKKAAQHRFVCLSRGMTQSEREEEKGARASPVTTSLDFGKGKKKVRTEIMKCPSPRTYPLFLSRKKGNDHRTNSGLHIGTQSWKGAITARLLKKTEQFKPRGTEASKERQNSCSHRIKRKRGKRLSRKTEILAYLVVLASRETAKREVQSVLGREVVRLLS